MSNASIPSGAYFNLKGKTAEKAIHEVAQRSFFTDWCFANPTYKAGKQKKELCDLLVVFDDITIIVQVKNCVVEDGAFKQSDVEDNLVQVMGARRNLVKIKRPIVLTNPRRTPSHFDPGQINRLYLVSIMLGAPTRPSEFARVIDGHIVHMFNGAFFELMISELDTIADFVHYLDEKEQFLRTAQSRGQVVRVLGGEQNLMAAYLIHGRNLQNDHPHPILDIPGDLWTLFSSSAEYDLRAAANKQSYWWDHLIDIAHEKRDEHYELIARELAKHNRLARRHIANRYRHDYDNAIADSQCDMLRSVLYTGISTYCFLFIDEKFSKEHRKNELALLCEYARGRFRDNRLVVGIASEKKVSPQYNYQFVYYDVPEWTEALERRYQQLSEAGYLSKAAERHTRVFEYPVEQPESGVVDISPQDDPSKVNHQPL